MSGSHRPGLRLPGSNCRGNNILKTGKSQRENTMGSENDTEGGGLFSGDGDKKGASIKKWPVSDRPRERMRRLGPSALSDRELMMIILGSAGRSGKYNVLDVASEILSVTGGFKALGLLTFEELTACPSIGPAKAALISAVMEMAKRYNSLAADPGVRLRGCRDVASIYSPRLEGLKYEVFRVLLLDSRNSIIRDMEISQGSLNESIVHPREVFSTAIRHSASSLILVHNHPSGDPEPSREDIAVTERLTAVGELVQIRVLDHVIVGNGRFVSFAERGLMG